MVTFRQLAFDDEIFSENTYTSDSSDEVVDEICNRSSSSDESIIAPTYSPIIYDVDDDDNAMNDDISRLLSV